MNPDYIILWVVLVSMAQSVVRNDDFNVFGLEPSAAPPLASVFHEHLAELHNRGFMEWAQPSVTLVLPMG